MSFDLGGVIDAAPERFALLMRGLRERGVRVIVVSAIGHREEVGVLDNATMRAFTHGRLHAHGLRVGEHYDAAYASTWSHAGQVTGFSKDVVMAEEAPVLHVDDDADVAEGIACCPVHLFDGENFVALVRAIDAALGGV